MIFFVFVQPPGRTSRSVHSSRWGFSSVGRIANRSLFLLPRRPRDPFLLLPLPPFLSSVSAFAPSLPRDHLTRGAKGQSIYDIFISYPLTLSLSVHKIYLYCLSATLRYILTPFCEDVVYGWPPKGISRAPPPLSDR